jgi:hypothetical protein
MQSEFSRSQVLGWDGGCGWILVASIVISAGCTSFRSPSSTLKPGVVSGLECITIVAKGLE